MDLKQEYKLPVIICGDINTAHHPIDLKNRPPTKTPLVFYRMSASF